MKKLDLNDMRILVDNFHDKVFTKENELEITECAIGILTEEYQRIYNQTSIGSFTIGRFNCCFTYDRMVFSPNDERRQGINVVFEDNMKIMRQFKKSLQVFLHLYDNPEGYFRLERIMFEIL